MITIKVEKQARVTEDLNIEAPLFKKDLSDKYIAVIDADTILSLFEYRDYIAIIKRNSEGLTSTEVHLIQDGETVSADEFWSKFDEAVKGMKEPSLKAEQTA